MPRPGISEPGRAPVDLPVPLGLREARRVGEFVDRHCQNLAMKFLVLIALIFGVAVSVHADTITGRVVGVADGDTVTVLATNHQQHKIRLAGIDAPEKTQPFGTRSKQDLSDLVFNKEVRVDSAKVSGSNLIDCS